MTVDFSLIPDVSADKAYREINHLLLDDIAARVSASRPLIKLELKKEGGMVKTFTEQLLSRVIKSDGKYRFLVHDVENDTKHLLDPQSLATIEQLYWNNARPLKIER